MIHIYTDVAHNKGRAAATVMALTDKSFVGFYTYVFKDVPNSTYGELQAILAGLRSIKLRHNESYTVHTDSSSALQFLTSQNGYHRSKECFGVATKIFKEAEGFDVTFSLCVGHMPSHGPNKVVDRASNLILRNVLKEDT